MITIAKLAIFGLVAWWVGETLRGGWAEIRNHDWHIEPGWLLAAGAIYLVGLAPAGLYWHHILRTLGQEASLTAAMRAYYIGHLGKYVPGKALVIVLRAGLISSRGVTPFVAGLSVLLETLTMMAVGAFLAAMILVIRYHDQEFLMGIAVLMMCAAGAPTLPPVFQRLYRWTRRGRMTPEEERSLHRLGFANLLIGWFAMSIVWVTLGLSLWATMRALGASAPLPEAFPALVCATSLAMVAGFLSLIPGGLGVRDGVLTQILVGDFGQAIALGAAVLLRLTWLVAELIISVILYPFGVRLRRSASHP